MAVDNNSIDAVREIVRIRLGQLSRGVGEFRETYLMSDSKFSGVRFEQGLFGALWKLDANEVRVMRESQQVLVIPIDQVSISEKRAA